MRVDAVILTALNTEKAAADRVLKKGSSKRVFSGIHYDYDVYTLNGSGLRVALAPPSGMGQINAAVGASKMLVDLHPMVTFLIGIAGCMVDKSQGLMFLGDIVIADQIHDYELKKKKNGWSNRDIALTRAVRNCCLSSETRSLTRRGEKLSTNDPVIRMHLRKCTSATCLAEMWSLPIRI